MPTMFKYVYIPGRLPAELSWQQFLADPRPVGTGVSSSAFSDLPDQINLTGEALIVAPHAAIHPDLPKLFDTCANSLPDDWDAVTLGAYFKSQPTYVAGHVFRPSEFSVVHGLALRDRAVVSLRNAPKETSIEEALNSRIHDGSLNVYSLWPNLRS